MIKLLEPIYPHSSIANIESLLKVIGIDYGELEIILNNINSHYFANKPEIKPNGGIRQTYRVETCLEKIHERIKNRIFRKVLYPVYLQGSIKDSSKPRSYINNCNFHTNKKILIKIDVSDFFPSIKSEKVLQMWKYLFNFSPDISEILTKLTTYNGFVPQGAKTSSYIANLILWHIEPKVCQLFESKGYVYTRLVDDISISSSNEITNTEKSFIIENIISMLNKTDLKTNRKKLKITKNNKKMRLHNLNVNRDKPSIPKSERNKIRAAVHECEKQAKLNRSSEEYKKLYGSTRGRLNIFCKLHSNSGNNLKQRLDLIKPH